MSKTIGIILCAMLAGIASVGAWPWHKNADQAAGVRAGGDVVAGNNAGRDGAVPSQVPADGRATNRPEADAPRTVEANLPRGIDANAPRINYVDTEGQYGKPLVLLWSLNLNNPLKGVVWIGSASKEIPYGEQERRDLAEAMVRRELEAMKKEFAAKKKGGEGGKDVKELLNQFLGEGMDAEKNDSPVVASPKAGDGKEVKDGADGVAAKPAAEGGFDEEDARKKILRRLVVPNSKIVEARAGYFQLADGNLHCVELATGITNWILPLRGMLDGVPFETRDAIHFVMKGALCAIDKRSGLLLHRSVLDQAVFPAPFATESAIYLGTYRSRVMQWDPKGSFSLWNKLLTGEISGGITGNDEAVLVPQENGELVCLGFDGLEKWSFINKGTAEDRVYYERELRKIIDEIHKEEADAKKEEREKDMAKIRAWEARAKELERELDLLRQRIRGRFLCLPVTKGDAVYIGSTDYNLYRVNRYTGLPEWQYVCKGQIMESPLVTAETVWQRDTTGVLHGVAVKSGESRARIDQVHRVLQATDEMVFFQMEESSVLSVRTAAHGVNRLEGVRGCRISPEGDVLLSFDAGSSAVYAFSLSAVRR